jgi:REP element-mobilizing transposase RayT
MKLLEELKKSSSKRIKMQNEKYWNFYWQDGYGIFSVNPAEIDKVIAYIQGQKEHHKKQMFKDELLVFLKKYGVAYDEKYLWD